MMPNAWTRVRIRTQQVRRYRRGRSRECHRRFRVRLEAMVGVPRRAMPWHATHGEYRSVKRADRRSVRLLSREWSPEDG